MANKLIFFVDDDKMILHLLEYVFHNLEEYAFKSFTSGEECLANIQLKPDVIVLDHLFTIGDKTMMSGMDVLRKILDVNSESKVIMLTSQDNRELIPEFIKSGAIRYIAKDSYFIDTLVDAIKEIA